MLADYHVHTEFSDDSTEKMEVIIKKAIALGFEEICFTDHVDYGVKTDHDEEQKIGKFLNVDYPNYFRKISELKRKYKNQLTIKQGLEFGIQTHTIGKYQKLFNAYNLDFVILSCHQVKDNEFWTYDFQKGKSPDTYNTEYYSEIYKCITQYKDYSVLGHLDVIQRYNDVPYPFEKSKEIITKILKMVIKDHKGIEVNTSSFRYGLKGLMPARDILELYYQLGGKIITIGSDCHKAKDLGEDFLKTKMKLKKIGFTHFCTFDKMKPIYHKF
ncbi:MAG: histidinol-phosphatase HisJ family protein [Eubacteriaceae bacterium]